MSSSAITGPIFSDVRRSPSGSAAAPSWAFNESTGTGIYLASTDVLALSTAGVQRVVVDAAGRVGIGTASPATLLDVSTGVARGFTIGADNGAATRTDLTTKVGRVTVPHYTNSELPFAPISGASTSTENIVEIGSNTSSLNAVSRISFYTGATITGGTLATERMRIDASGDVTIQSPGKLLINNTFGSGNTGNYILQTPVGGNSSCLTLAANGSSYFGMTIRGQNTSTYRALNFLNNTNNSIGRIDCTTTATSYISGASDYRLKEEIAPLSGGLDKVCAMKPVSFKWKESQKEDYGFIAHELQAVIPEAISGEKDAVDAEGNPEYQAIFPAPAQMVASLVAAIQELKTELDEAKAKIAALEAK